MEQPAAFELQRQAPTENEYRMSRIDQDILDAIGYKPGRQSIATLDPYLRWIKSSSPGMRKIEDYLNLFIDVVCHFRKGGDQFHHAIRTYINEIANAETNHYYFHDTSPGSAERQTSVEDTILIIIGVWTLMRPYFVPVQGHQKRVVLSFCLKSGTPYSEVKAFEQSPSELIRSCGLLPNADESAVLPETAQSSIPCAADQPSITRTADFSFGLHAGLIESHSIPTKILNASRLSSLAGVRIIWTDNLSRHLLLSKTGQRHYLELFGLPCALQGRPPESLHKAGITPALVYEVQSTYANLFNPVRVSSVHGTLTAYTGLRYCCWCVGCASWRFRTHEIKRLLQDPYKKKPGAPGWSAQLPYDPELESLMRQEATSWNQAEFPDLWPRILALDHHLQAARPWNFWILFRDSRDTIQYWTFL
ncbi:hypothetical protein PG993_011206 [Apiospora rasikravindrae]|uniref:Uncharacterized protein n=1 Tax=Apiospora rasikravindrae TaxID=990691 RepID=A0ABR1SDJ5_9PEZI